MLEFFQRLPPCLIGMEACASAHCRTEGAPPAQHRTKGAPPAQHRTKGAPPAQHRTKGAPPAQHRTKGAPPAQHRTEGAPARNIAPKVRLRRNARELAKFGHEVRLMQPSYVKGYVKRGKTDAADAEAICEAVSRPSMRFVPVKSEDTQALLMTHKAREFLVRQQTQIVNAMRAHLGAFGIVVPKGIHNVERLIIACEKAQLPTPARKALNLFADQLIDTQKKIEELTADIRAAAKANEDARRLQTIPGFGPITASAMVSALPDIAEFKSGRDLSAWLGLTPRPHATGGKERLGRISKMGNSYLRRLLYLGAVVPQARHLGAVMPQARHLGAVMPQARLRRDAQVSARRRAWGRLAVEAH